MFFRILTVFALALALTACNAVKKDGQYYQDDGPPRFRKGPDPDSVPDAVPRNESISRYGNKPYTALGQRFVPMNSAHGFRQTGHASWYGRKYHGNRTSSGETYDMYAMTAAHPTLPLPSYVHVRNLDNNREVVVRVNDRGPFLNSRIIDLSYMAAQKLGIVATGTGRVKIRTVFAGETPKVSTNSVSGASVPVASVNSASGADIVIRYMLQAGSFASTSNAERMRRKLQQGGYDNVRIERVIVSGRQYHRVQIGPYETKRAAGLIADTIEEVLNSPVSMVTTGAG